MSYELAKQLIDSGLPHGWLPGEHESYEQGGDFFFPTLTDLIAACGNGFFGLTHWPEGWTAAGGVVIENEERTSTAQIQVHHFQTPEEAVARLWLALNKRSSKPTVVIDD